MILVACGLKREARILERAGIVAVPGGGVAAALERRLEAALACHPDARLILSCGIAGALHPSLRVGDVVIDLKPLPFRGGVGVGAIPGHRLGETEASHPGPSPEGEGLRKLLPNAHHGTIIGQDHIAATVAEKATLHAATGALAVDMESHVAARVADRHGLPFAAIRVISDSAQEDLPPAALVGMNPDGSMALGRVVASLARRPSQLPILIRTGRNAEAAFRKLREIGDALESLSSQAR